MSIDIEAVEFISRERGIDPAFIEKDWYAVQVLKALADFSMMRLRLYLLAEQACQKGMAYYSVFLRI